MPDGPTCARVYEEYSGEGSYLTSGEGAVSDLREFPLGNKLRFKIIPFGLKIIQDNELFKVSLFSSCSKTK